MAATPAREWLALVITTSWFYGITTITAPSTVYIGKPLIYFLTNSKYSFHLG